MGDVKRIMPSWRALALVGISVAGVVQDGRHNSTWSVQGVGGPLTANVHGTIEPVQDGTQARVTIDMDFEGHGMGGFFISGIARRAARRQLPQNLRNLKRVLEQSQ